MTSVEHSEVHKSLKEVMHWKNLGIHLQLNTASLDEIEQDHGRTAIRRTEMVNLWFRTDPHPTWSKLCTALEAVDQNSIAATIRSKHTYQYYAE